MPSSHEVPFKVFYSWQSDLPDAVNLKLIRNALNQAGNAMNTDHDLNLHVVIDEATREVPGSPNIADSIFTKIKESDVFVCDLSKVAEVQNEAGTTRKYCNPNAALELGYAVRVLGWNRIIIVFNEAYGVIPDDLPFDARGHRTSTYRCLMEAGETGRATAACLSQISNATGSLRVTLETALKLIARENPKRPQELEGKSPEVLQRERDVEQLRKVFYWINTNMLDRFIDRVLNDGRLLFSGSTFSECLGAVINGSSFHFYDDTLKALVVEFYRAWRRCFTHAESMDAAPNGTELYWPAPGDYFTSPEQEQRYRFTTAQARPLREALDALLNYVRENYLAIDLSESGREAIQEYLSTD